MIPTRIVVPITVLLSVLPCRGSSSKTTGGGDARAMDVVDSLPQGSHAELYVAEVMVGVSVANAGIITLTACFMFLPQACSLRQELKISLRVQELHTHPGSVVLNRKGEDQH